MASNMDHDYHRDGAAWGPVEQPKSFALSGKIILSTIVILLAVIVLMLLLHVYARWYLLTVHRREIRHRRRRARSSRRTHLAFYADNGTPGSVTVAINSGLEESILSSLPVFVYLSKTHPELQECSVCLSEFEDNEKGRLLPKCNHSFHIECIDMWFHSHSTCPLCRSTVEAAGFQTQAQENNLHEVVLNVDGEPGDAEPGSSSGSQNVEENNASTSLGLRRKGFELNRVTLDVPRRNELEGESGVSTLVSQGFKSPGSRLLSFKRLLSMNRIIGPGTGSGSGGADSSYVECGKDELTEGQTRPQTPR